MRAKTYRVHLTEDEEKRLNDLVGQGIHPARQVTRARVLLLLHEKTDPEGKPIKAPELKEIAEQCRCHTDLVYKVGKQYVKEGIERVLNRKKRETPPIPAKVTRELEEKLLALSRKEPPPGYDRWTLRLLEERSKAELGIDLSDTTIRLVLLKNAPKPASA